MLIIVSFPFLIPIFSIKTGIPDKLKTKNNNWQTAMIANNSNSNSTTNPIDKFIQLILVCEEEKKPIEEFHAVPIPIDTLEKKPYSEK